MRPSFFLLVLFSLAFASPAAAYLDPATGSMLVQLLLGGAAGLAVATRIFWRRILGLFGRRRPDDDAAG
ncbi:MAG TPA: hypothetical protein VMT16_10475 [Thermoanaerobaculia bacterium]|nr:hypothetical protein [Thermoanaerobaculia bacterium]